MNQQKFYTVPHQVAYRVAPVSINGDGSISATVTFGYIKESAELKDDAGEVAQPADREFVQIAVNSQYISTQDAQALLTQVTLAGETMQDAMERIVRDYFVSKGVLNF